MLQPFARLRDQAKKAPRTKAIPEMRAELAAIGPSAAPEEEVGEADEVEVPVLEPVLGEPVLVSEMVGETVGELDGGYVLPSGLISKVSDLEMISVRFRGFANLYIYSWKRMY